eukprot:CAMPEP_0171082610 /NCGR_PEP_ID=MMETSP0766_2-20121228/17216_1 /TAXON_ID=439317 /ORGANISM="Gambierdiscus australes, Strain CAWD 149" /LENGTH=60 /DNA_ID=CAMNT_0011539985 /DNA_START=148 /DNA_END=330 /DNA_ORIENTATION=+
MKNTFLDFHGPEEVLVTAPRRARSCPAALRVPASNAASPTPSLHHAVQRVPPLRRVRPPA